MAETYLTLLRVGPDLKGNEKGILKVMEGNRQKAVFSTRENDANLRYSSLRVGEYEMKHSTKEFSLDGTPCTPIPCLRPTNEGIGSILIHRAYNDDPETLKGCIAPGTFGLLYSFEDSEKAMEELFSYLDGYIPEKTVVLKVLSNASGVGFDETKDNWKRIK